MVVLDNVSAEIATVDEHDFAEIAVSVAIDIAAADAVVVVLKFGGNDDDAVLEANSNVVVAVSDLARG